MSASCRLLIESIGSDAPLYALEPTQGEVEAASPQLAGYYSDPYNLSMMAHEGTMSAADVTAYYRTARDRGNRLFLLYCGGMLVGDADFRAFNTDSAEFAILVGARKLQGQGFGRRFSAMLHAVAFGSGLCLERVYATIIPANRASLRLFKWLGYVPDRGSRARGLVDDESDVTLSIDQPMFEQSVPEEMRRIRMSDRNSAIRISMVR